jgi:hypothetical protein
MPLHRHVSIVSHFVITIFRLVLVPSLEDDLLSITL